MWKLAITCAFLHSIFLGQSVSCSNDHGSLSKQTVRSQSDRIPYRYASDYDLYTKSDQQQVNTLQSDHRPEELNFSSSEQFSKVEKKAKLLNRSKEDYESDQKPKNKLEQDLGQNLNSKNQSNQGSEKNLKLDLEQGLQSPKSISLNLTLFDNRKCGVIDEKLINEDDNLFKLKNFVIQKIHYRKSNNRKQDSLQKSKHHSLLNNAQHDSLQSLSNYQFNYNRKFVAHPPRTHKQPILSPHKINQSYYHTLNTHPYDSFPIATYSLYHPIINHQMYDSSNLNFKKINSPENYQKSNYPHSFFEEKPLRESPLNELSLYKRTQYNQRNSSLNNDTKQNQQNSSYTIGDKLSLANDSFHLENVRNLFPFRNANLHNSIGQRKLSVKYKHKDSDRSQSFASFSSTNQHDRRNIPIDQYDVDSNSNFHHEDAQSENVNFDLVEESRQVLRSFDVKFFTNNTFDEGSRLENKENEKKYKGPRVGEEDEMQINVIDYPLVINRLCSPKRQPLNFNIIDHHLTLVNQCVEGLVKARFCQKNFRLDCDQIVQDSILELKKAKYLSCLNNGQLEILESIEKLLAGNLRRPNGGLRDEEIYSNKKNSNSESFTEEDHEKIDEKYINRSSFIEYDDASLENQNDPLIVYLFDSKSNSSKFILPLNFIGTYSSAFEPLTSKHSTLDLGKSEFDDRINTINVLVKRCDTSINECIIKDFSCCLSKPSKDDEKRKNIIGPNRFCDFENKAKVRLKKANCHHLKNTDCKARYILKLILQSISILAVLVGSTLFFILKLHLEIRVQVHLNFFLSSLFTSVFSILLSSLVLENCYHREGLIEENPFWCRALLVVYRYSRLTNYFWLLCEAVYLHQLVVRAFRKVKFLFKFCLIGWLIPFLLMIPYVVMHLKPERNVGCWIDDEDHSFEWVYHLPPIICLVVNSILLVNITRVLYHKLSSKHFRTAQKTILSITPIFGLQYLFSIIRPLERFDRTAVMIGYVGLVIDSSQGLIIAILFCFCNSKVYNFIKQSVTKKSTDQETGLIEDL